MDKKQKEQNVLALIYSKDDYAEIVNSEEPDFKIRHKYSTNFFGVEVTEFYYSESNARLRNISTYFTELINQNRYRHKNDRKELDVREFTITSAEGANKGTTKGILRQLPTVEDYVQMIIRIIANKESKLGEYKRNLTHVNLIILDTENRLSTVPIREYYRHLFTESLRESLYNTGFREIFLITTLHEKRRVYIPLKMILLVAELYMFRQLLLDYFPQKIKITINNFMKLFAKYMRYKTRNAFYRETEGSIEVIWGNTGIMRGRKNNSINDYYDNPLPENIITPKLQGSIRFFNSEAFRINSMKLFEKGTFSTELAFDVKGEVEF